MDDHHYNLLEDAVNSWKTAYSNHSKNKNKVLGIRPKYYLYAFGIALIFILGIS
jgi:hypothetical protein